MLFLESLSLSLCVGGGEHCRSGGDHSVGWPTSPLGKRRIEKVTAKRVHLRHGPEKEEGKKNPKVAGVLPVP